MALPFTEAFTGSAGLLANPPWTQAAIAGTTTRLNYDGSGHGKSTAVDNNDIIVFDNSNTYPNDQYAQVVLAGGITSGLTYAGVTVRCSGTGGSFAGYEFITDTASGAAHTELWVYNAGTGTLLRNFATTFATGDVMRIEVVGTTITCLKALAASPTSFSSLGTQSDSSVTSGAAGCMVFNSPGGSNTALIDNFEGGSLVTTSAALTGTGVPSMAETDIVAGGKTIIVTLTGDTFIGI